MADAEVQVDASKGFLMVRGEQAFVSETLERYKSVFETAAKQISKTAVPGEVPSSSAVKISGGGLEAFSNVYDIDGDTTSILVSPPGKTITAQARAIVLLTLYARYKIGQEPTALDLIKDQCKAHACLDPKNFVGHVKSQKSYVTVSGSNSAATARLTVPGRKAAEELAQSLQGGE